MARAASHVHRMSPNSRPKAEPETWPPSDAKWTAGDSSLTAMPMNYEQCSPVESCTDTSEDSVDVRVGPVTLPSAAYSASIAGRRNKRKPAEPRRVPGGKRFRWDSDSDCSSNHAAGEEAKALDSEVDPSDDDNEDESSRSKQQQQHSSKTPVPLVGHQQLCPPSTRNNTDGTQLCPSSTESRSSRTDGTSRSSPSFVVPPITPSVRTCRPTTSSAVHCASVEQNRGNKSSSLSMAGASCSSASSSGGGNMSAKQKQRNYKNMTRERRIEANARERTRVHTISAAFESLRRAVPAYSCNQKLSKLAILRIACSYILALGSLNEEDYSREQDSPSFSECVDLCTSTIQSEGRARRRKE